jgi:hypothetical protein
LGISLARQEFYSLHGPIVKLPRGGARGIARLKREWNLQLVNTLERFSSGIAPREIRVCSMVNNLPIDTFFMTTEGGS